jgi:hypothetical protein
VKNGTLFLQTVKKQFTSLLTPHSSLLQTKKPPEARFLRAGVPENRHMNILPGELESGKGCGTLGGARPPVKENNLVSSLGFSPYMNALIYRRRSDVYATIGALTAYNQPDAGRYRFGWAGKSDFPPVALSSGPTILPCGKSQRPA